MDTTIKTTAKEIVNSWSEQKLAEIFKLYGEEPSYRKIAKAIVEERRRQRFHTTRQLAIFIEKLKRGRGKLHPATLIFQALRMAVNEELKEIEEGLQIAINCLREDGRLGVLSFHRLEDRIVKNLFKKAAREKEVLLVTKKPLTPSLKEKKTNPRSRSAKLRFVEKVCIGN